MQKTTTNILILGAGPGGATTALFLAKAGIACTLVDKAVFPRDKICGDALSGKVVEVLRKIDPSWLDELHLNPEVFLGSYGVTFVAPNTKALRVPFKKNTDTSQAPPGFISKRLHFDNWLIEKVRQEPLIDFVEGMECRDFEKTATGFLVKTKQQHVFDASLVIAADGAYSAFAKQIGGLQTEPAHNCFGLRAYYKNVAGMDAQNFIELHFLKEFLPGYFWIFPLPNGLVNVGVGMRADVLHEKKINLKKAFEQLIATNETMKNRFANAELMEDVKLFGLPLGSKKRQLLGDNYLLIGDAAMLIDPFTGEGIGNAMMSGMLAAETAVKAVAAKNYSSDFLSSYEQRVYLRLWSELKLSYRMQQLVNFPWLFNFVVNKASSNAALQDTISCMFEDLDMRSRLKDPRFYWKLMWN